MTDMRRSRNAWNVDRLEHEHKHTHMSTLRQSNALTGKHSHIHAQTHTQTHIDTVC